MTTRRSPSRVERTTIPRSCRLSSIRVAVGAVTPAPSARSPTHDARPGQRQHLEQGVLGAAQLGDRGYPVEAPAHASLGAGEVVERLLKGLQLGRLGIDTVADILSMLTSCPAKDSSATE